MRSLSTTTTLRRDRKFKIKFNIFTFRDTQESKVAQSLKLNLIFLLSGTHKNHTSQKVANLSVLMEVTMVIFSRRVASTRQEMFK